MRKKILIADDDTNTVDFLEKGLVREGFEVVSASDGEDAKDEILQNTPDLIILDLGMPRLDGWEFLKWLREEVKSNTPVIIVSGKDEMSDMKKGYRLEADSYLVKPISVNDILGVIHAICSFEVDKG